MDRYILTDAQWAKMEPFCLGKVTDRGRSGKDNRLFLEIMAVSAWYSQILKTIEQ